MSETRVSNVWLRTEQINFLKWFVLRCSRYQVWGLRQIRLKAVPDTIAAKDVAEVEVQFLEDDETFCLIKPGEVWVPPRKFTTAQGIRMVAKAEDPSRSVACIEIDLSISEPAI